jgi:hypothetical protein
LCRSIVSGEIVVDCSTQRRTADQVRVHAGLNGRLSTSCLSFTPSRSVCAPFRQATVHLGQFGVFLIVCQRLVEQSAVHFVGPELLVSFDFFPL